MVKTDSRISTFSNSKMADPSFATSGGSNGLAQAEQVRVISRDEHEAAAASLAEAFRYDEVAQYFVKTPDTETWTLDQKWEVHLQIMRCIVLAHCISGLALTYYRMPPGKNMDGQKTMLLSGLSELNKQLSEEGNCRFIEFMQLLHQTKTEVLGKYDENSWYLVYIGTRKEARGQGYARMLIDHVTRQADAEGYMCYLESSDGKNPAIYQRFGFTTVQSIKLTRGSKPVELDIMVRHPGSREASCDARTIAHHGQTAETA
ncbi:MAG: hypothetical protein Q9177_003202 [Variospora cf. flavescens]